MSDTSNTLTVLRWAKQLACQNETVKIFWEAFCDAINAASEISPEDAYHELRLYGSNTLLMPFRKPVTYNEVAYDVADALSPMFSEGDQYRKNSQASCEKYVLKKMSVSSDDLKVICSTINDFGENSSIKMSAGKAGSTIVAEAVTLQTAKSIAHATAERALAKAASEVGKKTATKAAQKAAEEAAKQVAQRIIVGMNIILVAITIISIAGPAMRVTIPAVTYISLLRKMYSHSLKGV